MTHRRPENESESQIYTPTAENTNSEEIYKLARFWISKCTGPEHESCPNENFNNRLRHYPTRLIELPPYDLGSSQGANLDEIEVRLVESKDIVVLPVQYHDDYPEFRAQNQRSRTDRIAGEYVTLSHCWGEKQFTRLLRDNYKHFKTGIALKTLPLTFRHAIQFACRLSRAVRYIWIDSLCIVQDDKEDWLAESVQMYEIYRNSFCNLSATAASDSEQGLFFPRDPQHLWENEVSLNTKELSDPRSTTRPHQYLGIEPLIKRCTIQDISFWDRTVEDAPVNRRAWVLQERLLAPRILHFCQGQIAWECRHIDAAECRPHGVSHIELRSQEVKLEESARLKGLIPDDYGPKPIAVEPTEASQAAHKNWKLVVERYSRTALTNSEDRLIAVAGIAELMSSRIGNELKYVAGMWEMYLASQLLWRVNDVYKDGQLVLSNPSRRPTSYRAPSFSWVAVDAPVCE